MGYKRLTAIESDKCEVLKKECVEMCGNCPADNKYYKRLAAYEDSGLSPEEVQALKRENEVLKQEKRDLFREVLRLSREEQDYVIRYNNDADESGKRTIDDDFTYGPIYSDD